MIRPKIGLDFDDVVAPFNSIACELANKDYGTDITIQDITCWEHTEKTSILKQYYHDKRTYDLQVGRIPEETKESIRDLMQIADVYFISAVYPEFMSVRAAQIMAAFPEISESRIILGAAKNLVHFDFLLDDNINNVLSSPADYPVLFRKPWNTDMTGLLSVNTIEEFVCLVEHVLQPDADYRLFVYRPCVIALVGPTGSGKNEVANKMYAQPLFSRPTGYTTKPNDKNRVCLSEKDFNKKNFFEKTRYAGYGYGIEKDEITKLLKNGTYPVIPIDICGAIGMKKHFPTIIVYLKRGKCELVMNIISDETLSNKEKQLRILSLDAEKKNESICDLCFKADNAASEIFNLVNQK